MIYKSSNPINYAFCRQSFSNKLVKVVKLKSGNQASSKKVSSKVVKVVIPSIMHFVAKVFQIKS